MFEIRITVWTDFMQGVVSGFIKNVILGMTKYEESKGHITKFEFTERVLDGRTFKELIADQEQEK